MSCLRLRVGSTRLQPPGLTLQMEGPGVLASPIRRVGGTQPNCRYPRQKTALQRLKEVTFHR
eukprot:4680729-Amphidinium_carterae.1